MPHKQRAINTTCWVGPKESVHVFDIRFGVRQANLHKLFVGDEAQNQFQNNSREGVFGSIHVFPGNTGFVVNRVKPDDTIGFIRKFP